MFGSLSRTRPRGRNLAGAGILAVVLSGGTFGQPAPAAPGGSSARTPSSGSSKPTTRDSIQVKANLSPEEVEEQKLNDAYQAISQQQGRGTCTPAIIERYKSEVIPLSEKSAFDIPKNKFLFLANRDVGNCYLALQNFSEAEASFQKIIQYAPVWPGTDDSAYPINFREIGMAQMGQQQWKSAEESLQKSVSLFDPQIDKTLKSDSEFSRTEHAGNLRGSKATSLAYLGIVYVREGRMADALKAEDLAFAEASLANGKAALSSVVEIGRAVAKATGDQDAIKNWSSR
jgi:tetratricopeptide (TPR) repeat protein